MQLSIKWVLRGRLGVVGNTEDAAATGELAGVTMVQDAVEFLMDIPSSHR